MRAFTLATQMALLSPPGVDEWVAREPRRGTGAEARPPARPMRVEAEVAAELAALGAVGLAPFDAHSHTGMDIDGSTRSAAEHLAEARVLRRSLGDLSPLRRGRLRE